MTSWLCCPLKKTKRPGLAVKRERSCGLMMWVCCARDSLSVGGAVIPELGGMGNYQEPMRRFAVVRLVLARSSRPMSIGVYGAPSLYCNVLRDVRRLSPTSRRVAEIRQRRAGQRIVVGDKGAVMFFDGHDTGIVNCCHDADRDVAAQHAYDTAMPKTVRHDFLRNIPDDVGDFTKSIGQPHDFMNDKIIRGTTGDSRT